MTAYDEIAEAEADEECLAWIRKVTSAKEDIVAFVASRRPGHPKGEFDGYMKGSFNLCLSVKFDDGAPNAIIRFPKPGHTLTARREEKVKNEVMVLEYLRDNTSVPIPHITSWGLTEDSPLKLGPFIIMDKVEGALLVDLLKQPIEEEVIMRDDIDVAKLDYVYEQLAEIMLELSRLDFHAIGAITKNPETNEWSATGRPFTYSMNELATSVSKYPVDNFAPAPFHTTKEFIEYQFEESFTHLDVQRNIACNAGDAKRRYIARQRFRQLIPKFCKHNTGPFKFYCDDLQPSNMIADPETYKIHAILDWEFTHPLPAQFSYDPPWWLILKGPSFWLECYSMREFLDRYEPKLKQFLAALERVEARSSLPSSSRQPRLSARMRESWESGQFWFDFGIRHSFDVDTVYWEKFHMEGDDVLDEKQQIDMEEFVDKKMRIVMEYDADCKARGL